MDDHDEDLDSSCELNFDVYTVFAIPAVSMLAQGWIMVKKG
jgi:hypothetical protein